MHMKRYEPDYWTPTTLPCARCGRPLSDQSHIRHDEPEVAEKHRFEMHEEDASSLSEQQWRVWMRMSTKFWAGGFDPPLPPPAERRRLRKAAGLAQIDIAGMLHVGEDIVYRWEKPVGYDERGNRLPGREPVGSVRRAYAMLLEMAEQYGVSAWDEWHRRWGWGLP